MSIKEEIAEVFEQLDYSGRKTARLDCIKKFNKSAGTIRNWWLSPANDFSIPEEHQADVLDILKENLKKQSA